MKDKIGTIVMVVILVGLLLICNNLLKDEEKTTSNEIENTVNNSIVEEEIMSEKIIKGTSENFYEEVFESEKTVLIDFYADWCAPCKQIAPIVNEIAEEREDVKVVKVNIDDEQDIAIDFRVMSIPTLVVLKEGEVVNRGVGAIEKEQILDMLK